MNPIYEKLFDSYCVQTLREVCPYDHESRLFHVLSI